MGGFISLFLFSLFSLFLDNLKPSDCIGKGKAPRSGSLRVCLWACIIYNLILNFIPVPHLAVKFKPPKLNIFGKGC
jgi:hypothetical protein